MKLQNNTILITGGSSGIGLEFAKKLIKLGNMVIITGRDSQKLNEAKRILPEVHTIQGDVTSPEDMDILYQQIAKQFPELNIIINNAGIGKTLNLREKYDDDALIVELKTNLYAPIQITNKFLPILIEKKESAIVNITSALAFSPFPVVPIYSAAKAGLRSYTLSLRVQLRNTPVKVFELAPPTTQTDMLRGFAPEHMKGILAMSASDLVNYTLNKIEKDQLEICPGQAKRLRLMSRIAPGYVLKLMSKSFKRNSEHF